MKLSPPKCDSALPCATCVRFDIPCTRQTGKRSLEQQYDYLISHQSPEKILLTLPRECYDKLIRAIHVLYHACKGNSDTMGLEDITTRGILESLGLAGQMKPTAEPGLKDPSSQGTCSPSNSLNSPQVLI